MSPSTFFFFLGGGGFLGLCPAKKKVPGKEISDIQTELIRDTLHSEQLGGIKARLSNKGKNLALLFLKKVNSLEH